MGGGSAIRVCLFISQSIRDELLVDLPLAHFFLAKLVKRVGVFVGFDNLQSLDLELYK